MVAGPSSATSTVDDNGLHLAPFGPAAHTFPTREGHLAAPASSFIDCGRQHCPSSDLSSLDALLLRLLYNETRISLHSIFRALPLSRTVLRDSESPTAPHTEKPCTADAERDRLHWTENGDFQNTRRRSRTRTEPRTRCRPVVAEGRPFGPSFHVRGSCDHRQLPNRFALHLHKARSRRRSRQKHPRETALSSSSPCRFCNQERLPCRSSRATSS